MFAFPVQVSLRHTWNYPWRLVVIITLVVCDNHRPKKLTFHVKDFSCWKETKINKTIHLIISHPCIKILRGLTTFCFLHKCHPRSCDKSKYQTISYGINISDIIVVNCICNTTFDTTIFITNNCIKVNIQGILRLDWCGNDIRVLCTPAFGKFSKVLEGTHPQWINPTVHWLQSQVGSLQQWTLSEDNWIDEYLLVVLEGPAWLLWKQNQWLWSLRTVSLFQDQWESHEILCPWSVISVCGSSSRSSEPKWPLLWPASIQCLCSIPCLAFDLLAKWMQS